MNKRCKLVMLPTNEKAQIGNNVIILCDNAITNEPLRYGKKIQEPFNMYALEQHLYITSDDNIKDSDWCILFDDFGNVMSTPQQYLKTKAHVLNSGLKKIIATTDSSLKIDRKDSHPNSIWKLDGALLPQPSQSFIQKYIDEYNKGNIITDVLVEYEEIMQFEKNPEFYGTDKHYNTRLPSIERLKINPKDNTITIRRVKDSWSREEVADKIRQYQHSVDRNEVTTIAQWIKENL